MRGALAVVANPSDLAVAYYNCGNANAEMGELGQAITDFDQAIQLDPNYAEAYANRGVAYAQAGEKE